MGLGGGFLYSLIVGLGIVFSIPCHAFQARVLLDDVSTSNTVIGYFNVSVDDSRKQPKVLPYSRWSLQRQGQRLVFKNLADNKNLVFSGKHFRLEGSIAVAARSFARLDIVFDKKQTHWIVHLPIDQYLYGVLAAEVPSSWPEEALKAQAIASRTYFLYKKMERAQQLYDVRSDTFDQVFHSEAERHSALIHAVDATHDMVLLAKGNGGIFPAYFHSDCGGATSGEAQVWRKPASLNAPVKDPYCVEATKNNWTYAIDKTQLMAHLQNLFYLPKGVELQSILPRRDSESRALEIDFIFSEKIFKRVRADDLRKILGFGKLKSTQFEVVNTWNKFLFYGRGFGHGVGMCQWGAQRWARNGSDYKFILNHYYPNATIQKITPEKFQSLQAQVVY